MGSLAVAKTAAFRAELEQIKAKLELALSIRLAEQSLYEFYKQAWSVLEPTTPLSENWHLEYIAEHLEQVTHGEITRLIINVPPRSSKSTLATIVWPVWSWIAQPSKRWMFASYSQGLSSEHSVARRNLITSDWFVERWGRVFSLTEDTNRQNEFANDKTGRMFATSVGGTATGKGGDVIVIDDPHNTRQAESEAERTTTLRDADLGLSTRLNDPRTGAIVLIMQRLHEQDLTGHWLTQNPGLYTHIKLTSEAEHDETFVFPCSKRIVTRKAGELLQPSRQGAKELAEAKLTLGARGYAGQHMQRPAPAGGGLLLTKFWRRFTPRPSDDYEQVIQSWDLRFKEGKDSGDYVVGCVVGVRGPNRYLLDLVRGRWSFKESCDALHTLSAKWPQSDAKIVENKANGPALVSQLADSIPGLILVEPQGGKFERAQAMTPFLEAGNLWIPEDNYAPWVGDFVHECEQFPAGAHDDCVDSFGQAINYLRGASLEYLRVMAAW